MMAARRLCSWVLMGALVCLTVVSVCEGRVPPRVRSAPSAGDSGMIAFNVNAWLRLMREKISQLKMAVEESKRGCNGFPCMYTHLGAKAGKQALMKTLLSKLSECAHDPKCSPGKRRRRSTTAEAVLSMLTQYKTTS